nr:triple gene block 3 [Caper latent virus]
MQSTKGLLIFVSAFIVSYVLASYLQSTATGCSIRVTGESATVNNCGSSEELATIVRALGEALRSP